MEDSSSAPSLSESVQPPNRIAIIDFGSQVTQLIARRLRQVGVYSHIFPHCSEVLEQVAAFAPQGIVLSGGPKSLLEEKTEIDKKLFMLGCPLLGICFGEQILCFALGGKLKGAQDSEYGPAQLEIVEDCPLFDKEADSVWRAGARVAVWMSHTDKITSLPEGFRAIARTAKAPYAVIADEKRRFYGLQFHPEVSHTQEGARLLANFARKVCHCTGEWRAVDAIDQAVEDIRSKVGEGRVLCALSGGVDSTVAALLIQRAIGERLHTVFIDNGLLRAQEGRAEAKEVEAALRPYFGNNLLCVEEGERFLQALTGVTDPEKKRKIIGKIFVQCFENVAQDLEKTHGKIEYLGQGTLYPDVVESLPSRNASSSQTIKSHHNVGGLPAHMTMILIEPLRFFFKDEVRQIGKKLGLAETFLTRHPFPGPGLAVRLPGEVTQERCALLRRIDSVFLRALEREGLYKEIWQAFAVLLPITSVGVKGDARSVQACCVLRAIVSEDGMTAEPYPFTSAFLASVAAEIVNEVSEINRVLYDCTGKPPATIEWE